MHHVFVYGTLKRGFVNHDADGLAPCFTSVARSTQPYPLVVAGPWYSPVLFDEPGSGHRVGGELYTVNDETLDRLDRIEGVGRAGGYHRVTISVERDDGVCLQAWCYVKHREDVEVIHDGPFTDYHDTRYVPRTRRPGSIEESSMPAPKANDVKVFVPAKDFEHSLSFYTALGWRMNWRHGDGLAEIELARVRLYLQNFYAKDWAENFMIYVPVDDARAWHAHIESILAEDAYPEARAQPPKEEDYGALVTYCWDPCGVLIHFAQQLDA